MGANGGGNHPRDAARLDGFNIVEERFIDVAPGPPLSRFERTDHGMFRAVIVLGGVLIL